MMPRMISDCMPFFDHPFYDVRIVTKKGAYNKKSRGSVMLFQGIKDCFRISVFISAVKSQVDDFFIRIFTVRGIQSGELGNIGIADGTFSFVWKA